MKTIITQDKANKSFGYPQLDSNKKINVEFLPTDVIATTGSNLFVGNQSINGSLNIKSVVENVVVKSETGTTINFNFNSGSIFYISDSTNYLTYNIQNVPTSPQIAVTSVFVIEQGSVANLASEFQINNETITVKWINGVTPIGGNNKTDVISLTSFRINNSWNVLGSKTSFNL
jgi:hypothetical protein